METRIGCSGYYYNHWKGIFYPGDLPKKDWLVYYSRHFNTGEIRIVHSTLSRRMMFNTNLPIGAIFIIFTFLINFYL
jgi:hypothetical protein